MLQVVSEYICPNPSEFHNPLIVGRYGVLVGEPQYVLALSGQTGHKETHEVDDTEQSLEDMAIVVSVQGQIWRIQVYRSLFAKQAADVTVHSYHDAKPW
jgi:hypothetical protein